MARGGVPMISVMHVIDTGGPGGAETVFLNTSAALDTQRFRSVAVVNRSGWLSEALRSKGLEPKILAASGSFNVAYLRQLLRIVRRERPDVIVGHLYGSAVYANLVGLLSRTPVISVLHGQSDLGKPGKVESVKRWLVRRSARVVFVSGKLRDELAAALELDQKKCVVIPNGVDPTRFAGGKDKALRQELKVPADHVLVAAIGNLRRPKAYEVLLRAAHELRGRSLKYHVAIAGEGGNDLHRELLALRSQLQLDDTVTFLGLRSDVAEVLRGCDIYALTSNTEGFSISCVEAMAAGVPVVATRSGGPEEIIEHERSGLLVPTQAPAAVADAIERLATNPTFAAELTRNALERVHLRFTLKAMLGAYEQLFGLVANRQDFQPPAG